MATLKVSMKYGDYPRLNGVDVVLYKDSSNASQEFLRLFWKRGVTEQDLLKAVSEHFSVEGTRFFTPPEFEGSNFRIQGSLRTLRTRVRSANFTFWKGCGCDLAVVTVPFRLEPCTETGRQLVAKRKNARK